ncbi:hypothetical protein I546_2118 [Mycobacterium kansasii 732]|nr:hypothetical protein I546_2118 [Mycobacterium kansasii 732]
MEEHVAPFYWRYVTFKKFKKIELALLESSRTFGSGDDNSVSTP